MNYALSLVFVVFFISCLSNPANACYACIPACPAWGSQCQNVGNESGFASCSDCLNTSCPEENCFITVPRQQASGEVDVSCASSAAIYPPTQPLRPAELPGTIGADVRILSTGDVLIDKVLRGSPAHLAGLRPGDRLDSINEARAASVPYSRIIKMNPGLPVRVTVTRKGQTLKYDMVAVRLDQLNARTRARDAREAGASGAH